MKGLNSMELFNKEDLNEIRKDKTDRYFVPAELFDGMQYKLVRLEVKWAYVACLNVMLNNCEYDQENNAFIKDDSPAIIESLKALANKKVDREKINGYFKELEDGELIVHQGRNIYLRRIVDIF